MVDSAQNIITETSISADTKRGLIANHPLDIITPHTPLGEKFLRESSTSLI